MKATSMLLFTSGVCSYIAALLHMGSTRGETYSDIGNGLLLITIVLLLLRRPARDETR